MFAGLSAALPTVDIYANYSADTPPQEHGPYIILRWQEKVFKTRMHRGPRIVDVWVHIPQNISQDHADIDPILQTVIDAMQALPGTEGVDGYVVTSVDHTGDGPDYTDPAYGTITRNATFEVLSRVA